MVLTNSSIAIVRGSMQICHSWSSSHLFHPDYTLQKVIISERSFEQKNEKKWFKKIPRKQVDCATFHPAPAAITQSHHAGTRFLENFYGREESRPKNFDEPTLQMELIPSFAERFRSAIVVDRGGIGIRNRCPDWALARGQVHWRDDFYGGFFHPTWIWHSPEPIKHLNSCTCPG